MKKIMIVSNTIPPETNGQATMLGRLFSNIFTDQHIYVQRLPYIEKDKKVIKDNIYTVKPLISVKKTSHKFLKLLSLLAFPLEIYPLRKKIIKIIKKDKINNMIICTGTLADAPAAYFAARKMKIPYSFYIFDSYKEQQKLLPLKIIAGFFERLIIKNAANVIVLVNENPEG